MDPTLRADVTEGAHAFVKVFDSLGAKPSPETVEDLKDVTDQLMRACARVLISLGAYGQI